MKRTLSILCAAICLSTLTSFDCYKRVETESSETYVYICTGKSSKRFHKTSKCNGLNRCNGDIQKVTISKAKSIGRTACKICY